MEAQHSPACASFRFEPGVVNLIQTMKKPLRGVSAAFAKMVAMWKQSLASGNRYAFVVCNGRLDLDEPTKSQQAVVHYNFLNSLQHASPFLGWLRLSGKILNLKQGIILEDLASSLSEHVFPKLQRVVACILFVPMFVARSAAHRVILAFQLFSCVQTEGPTLQSGESLRRSFTARRGRGQSVKEKRGGRGSVVSRPSMCDLRPTERFSTGRDRCLFVCLCMCCVCVHVCESLLCMLCMEMCIMLGCVCGKAEQGERERDKRAKWA